MEADVPATPEPEIQRLYSPREVSSATGLHLETIKRLTRSGAIEFVNVAVGNRRPSYRYTAAAINAFIAKRSASRR